MVESVVVVSFSKVSNTFVVSVMSDTDVVLLSSPVKRLDSVV